MLNPSSLLLGFNSDDYPLPDYLDNINMVLKREGLNPYTFNFDRFFESWCPYSFTHQELTNIFLNELPINGTLELDDLEKVENWASLFIEEQIQKYKGDFVTLVTKSLQ